MRPDVLLDLRHALLSAAQVEVVVHGILDRADDPPDDLLQFFAPAQGFEVRRNAKDSSDASRVGQEVPFLPGSIHKSGGVLFVCVDCGFP
jgi:hypothetical protein